MRFFRVNISDRDLLDRVKILKEINGQIVSEDTLICPSNSDWRIAVCPLRGPKDEGQVCFINVDFLDEILEFCDDDETETNPDYLIGELLEKTFWKRKKYTENLQYLTYLDKHVS